MTTLNLKPKTIFVVTSFLLLIACFSLYLPHRSVADAPASIWTTDSCSDGQQDANHYGIGQTVYISGHKFDVDNTYNWSITGQPGQASCHPNTQVASGTYLVTNFDFFCFPAYVVRDSDCGEYKVDFENKSDNYRVGDSTPVETPTPTNTPIPTSTPISTNTPIPTETPISTPTSTPSLTSTPTPTTTDIPTATPTPTSTPLPTSTPVPTAVPTNTPSDNNNNVGGDESPTPTAILTQSIISSSPTVLGTSTNYLVDAIKNAFGGQVLGISSLPGTASGNLNTYLPSSNQVIDNHYISIPSLSLLQPVYQSQILGDQLLVGDNQLVLAQINGANVYYGHNQYGLFSGLYQLTPGQPVFVDNGSGVQQYTVTAKSNVNFSDLSVFDSATSADIFLVTCSRTYPNTRIVIKASLQ